MSEKNKQPPPEEQVEEPKRILLYSKALWKGVVPVFQCAKCDFSDESEDNMKLHILLHFPPEQRDTILDTLVYLEQRKG
jgi:hypothetical protein